MTHGHSSILTIYYKLWISCQLSNTIFIITKSNVMRFENNGFSLGPVCTRPDSMLPYVQKLLGVNIILGLVQRTQ